jgi:hypothetical protein
VPSVARPTIILFGSNGVLEDLILSGDVAGFTFTQITPFGAGVGSARAGTYNRWPIYSPGTPIATGDHRDEASVYYTFFTHTAPGHLDHSPFYVGQDALPGTPNQDGRSDYQLGGQITLYNTSPNYRYGLFLLGTEQAFFHGNRTRHSASLPGRCLLITTKPSITPKVITHPLHGFGSAGCGLKHFAAKQQKQMLCTCYAAQARVNPLRSGEPL